MNDLKRCRLCGEDKSLKYFYVKIKRYNGKECVYYDSCCKFCVSKRNRIDSLKRHEKTVFENKGKMADVLPVK